MALSVVAGLVDVGAAGDESDVGKAEEPKHVIVVGGGLAGKYRYLKPYFILR